MIKTLFEIVTLNVLEKLLKSTIDFIWQPNPSGYIIVMTHEFMNRVNDGQWHHCAISFSNTDGAYVSLDGVSIERSGLEVRKGYKSVPITPDMKTVYNYQPIEGEYWIKLDVKLEDDEAGSRIFSSSYVVSAL